MALNIMLQGTMSNAGKSLLSAGLCRICLLYTSMAALVYELRGECAQPEIEVVPGLSLIHILSPEVFMNDTNGTFYAVGVGPGDPELLTLQAANILKRCPVIAAPQTKSGQMLALDIARSALDLREKEILPLSFTMSREPCLLYTSRCV